MPYITRQDDISALPLSVRSLNCLRRADIHTIGAMMDYPADELINIRNMGKKSVDEIQSVVQSLNDGTGEYVLVEAREGIAEEATAAQETVDADGSVNCSKHRDGVTLRSARFSIGSTNKALAMTELCLIRGLGYKAKLYRNKYSSRHEKIRYLIEFEITDDPHIVETGAGHHCSVQFYRIEYGSRRQSSGSAHRPFNITEGRNGKFIFEFVGNCVIVMMRGSAERVSIIQIVITKDYAIDGNFIGIGGISHCRSYILQGNWCLVYIVRQELIRHNGKTELFHFFKVLFKCLAMKSLYGRKSIEANPTIGANGIVELAHRTRCIVAWRSEFFRFRQCGVDFIEVVSHHDGLPRHNNTFTSGNGFWNVDKPAGVAGDHFSYASVPSGRCFFESSIFVCELYRQSIQLVHGYNVVVQHPVMDFLYGFGLIEREKRNCMFCFFKGFDGIPYRFCG